MRATLLPPAILLALAAAARPAPAPVPPPKAAPAAARPAGPAHLGGWRMLWNSGEGDAVFYKDAADPTRGTYDCLWSGQRWVGTWHLAGAMLTVTEARLPDQADGVPGTPIDWSVALDATGLAGRLGTGGAFRLHRGETLPAPKAD